MDNENNGKVWFVSTRHNGRIVQGDMRVFADYDKLLKYLHSFAVKLEIPYSTILRSRKSSQTEGFVCYEVILNSYSEPINVTKDVAKDYVNEKKFKGDTVVRCWDCVKKITAKEADRNAELLDNINFYRCYCDDCAKKYGK